MPTRMSGIRSIPPAVTLLSLWFWFVPQHVIGVAKLGLILCLYTGVGNFINQMLHNIQESNKYYLCSN